jgi:hypothetical protein
MIETVAVQGEKDNEVVFSFTRQSALDYIAAVDDEREAACKWVYTMRGETPPPTVSLHDYELVVR